MSLGTEADRRPDRAARRSAGGSGRRLGGGGSTLAFSSPWSNFSCQYISVTLRQLPRRAPRVHERDQRHDQRHHRNDPQHGHHCDSTASTELNSRTVNLNSLILPPMAARRKTVLVIDAQDEARERLSQTLRRDYRVIRAASAEAGLALMDKEDVDVLVADVAAARRSAASTCCRSSARTSRSSRSS